MTTATETRKFPCVVALVGGGEQNGLQKMMVLHEHLEQHRGRIGAIANEAISGGVDKTMEACHAFSGHRVVNSRIVLL